MTLPRDGRPASSFGFLSCSSTSFYQLKVLLSSYYRNLQLSITYKMSSSLDQSTQSKVRSTALPVLLQPQNGTNHTQALFFGVAAVLAGFAVYKIWGSDIFPSSVKPSTSSSKSGGYSAPKQPAYTPQGGMLFTAVPLLTHSVSYTHSFSY